MEMMARSVDYFVSTPLSWTISGAIIILILLFLHSYFHATDDWRDHAVPCLNCKAPVLSEQLEARKRDADEIERLRMLLAGAALDVDHVLDQIKREFGSVKEAPADDGCGRK